MINKVLNIFFWKYFFQWPVFVGLLMLQELVESMLVVDLLGLIGEEDSIAIEGHAQLGLRHLRHLLPRKHGGRSDTWWRGTASSHRQIGQETVQLCSGADGDSPLVRRPIIPKK